MKGELVCPLIFNVSPSRRSADNVLDPLKFPDLFRRLGGIQLPESGIPHRVRNHLIVILDVRACTITN